MKKVYKTFPGTDNSSLEDKKKRTPQIKELVGQVLEKQTSKVYRNNQHQGKLYYKLVIQCENKPTVNKIFVFPDLLLKEQIWQDIQASNYFGKKYVFYCQQWMNNFKLIDWKELTNHGSN